MAVQLQPAFVLHSRPFRDTSVLLDILTRDYGRLGVLARGQRQAKKRVRMPVQPFNELLVSWQGKGELKTLTASDYGRVYPSLTANPLFAALYVNELLTRLLPQHDACPGVFADYRGFIGEIATIPGTAAVDIEPSLRRFELALLQELGYGINLVTEADSDRPLRPEGVYRYMNDGGFYPVTTDEPHSAAFYGADLLAIAAGELEATSVRRAAKRLLRITLEPHLGNKPLKSRELFRRAT